jgi:tRNA-specific 2-thiouridylase
LLKAEDGTKDQSYFLYRLNQQQLAKTLFPLAGLYKREVRRIAEAAGLHVALKKDSTGICFIGERPFKEFLMRYLPSRRARFVVSTTTACSANTMGWPTTPSASARACTSAVSRGARAATSGDHDAWFVARKDVAENILYVVQGHTIRPCWPTK